MTNERVERELREQEEKRNAHLEVLTAISAACLVGYLSSGRKMTTEGGIELSIEEAAILRAKNLLTLLEKEK